MFQSSDPCNIHHKRCISKKKKFIWLNTFWKCQILYPPLRKSHLKALRSLLGKNLVYLWFRQFCLIFNHRNVCVCVCVMPFFMPYSPYPSSIPWKALLRNTSLCSSLMTPSVTILLRCPPTLLPWNFPYLPQPGLGAPPGPAVHSASMHIAL